MSRITETRALRVHGLVQGVGFRPYVYRLAVEMSLAGSVCNQSDAVSIIVAGEPGKLDGFQARLIQQAPGRIDRVDARRLDSCPEPGFRILPGERQPGTADVLMPDLAICADCLEEYETPGNRRYRYPFISCAACGPRYSVCHALPWEREHTAWRDFPPCDDCWREFTSPLDRRFHATGISCPACGPRLRLATGETGTEALDAAARIVDEGGILAVKSMSGFHLIADAANTATVTRLKAGKRREKPFALLAPDVEWVEASLQPDQAERMTLTGSSAPIVLLENQDRCLEWLAPGTGMLGVMLPSNGLQLELQRRLNRPLVATSGNLSGEPLVFDNDTAMAQFTTLADGLLLHDLSLSCGLDDGVQRVMAGRPVTIRLGRGLAPYSLQVPAASMPGRGGYLGCGAHLKAGIALQVDHRIILGPHIGDLASPAIRDRYRCEKKRLPLLFGVSGGTEVTDLHPDYASTIEADYRSPAVPHHVAHAMSAWLEHQVDPPFLALTWDGTGLGPDGTIWGGEVLRFDPGFQWRRVASLRPFQLPPGESIARYPGRIGRVLLGESPGPGAVTCTSMGRLVEAAAALVGLREENRYEAQAAIEFESLARQATHAVPMDFHVSGDSLDWRPLLRALTETATAPSARALGFHEALARAAVAVCDEAGVGEVLLSGGVFQNRLLVETMLAEARNSSFTLHCHQHIPANDAGIAAGQCAAMALGVTESAGENC